MINFSLKNVLILIIVCVFTSQTSFANNNNLNQNSQITDKLAENLKQKNYSVLKQNTEEIKDFLITEKFIQDNSHPQKIETEPIRDFLITKEFISQNSTIKPIYKIYYKDDFAEKSLKNYKNVVYERKFYNFQNIHHIFIKVRPKEIISTRNPLNVGDSLVFYVAEDVKKDGKILIRQNETVSARVETISESGEYGVPADIIIGSFKIGKIPLTGEISKEGFTHTYWVIPVSQAAGFFIPFSNYAFKFIRGGNAKITPKETFELQLPDDFCGVTEAN